MRLCARGTHRWLCCRLRSCCYTVATERPFTGGRVIEARRIGKERFKTEGGFILARGKAGERDFLGGVAAGIAPSGGGESCARAVGRRAANANIRIKKTTMPQQPNG